MSAINQPAPPLDVQEWVQGAPSNIEQERGRVILLEVFQVNCPGCFIGGLPEAIEMCRRFDGQGLVVWGLATAFEDFTLNNLENLHKLIEKQEVVGETRTHLEKHHLLADGCWQYSIPFPVAWDRIVKSDHRDMELKAEQMIAHDMPHFATLPADYQRRVRQQVKAYLAGKAYDAKTFDVYGLQGTPSAVLIDKKGLLRHKIFGYGHRLEDFISSLLNE
jgi:hypothetical protein